MCLSPVYSQVSSLMGNKQIRTRIFDRASSMVREHCQQHLSEFFEPAVSELQQQNNARQSQYCILEKAASQADREAPSDVEFKFGFTLNVHRA